MQPFDLGRQCRAVLVGPDGAVIQLETVTGFDARQVVQKVRTNPLNGPPQEQQIPSGWEGSFEMSRQGRAADDLFSGMEARFWAGTPIPYCTLFQYVTERDGSISAYRYSNVSISLADAGSYRATEAVTQRIEFFASQKDIA
ncbi:hypothetical protein CR162_21350 [Pseudoroseomonas rhizosphaerae]|uniref:Phage tail protein n=1 Tax=Teichococcus rhizosphaerae TaxID=1335062 RepID=A0A2C7A4M9_9PROT|nr:hypothetical protein [Pseudoroseomonas rhizosphaerae]PHK92919.1 hypothetical protein CR162_21350 [Pseudoroseomonas rhizosphaerae]